MHVLKAFDILIYFDHIFLSSGKAFALIFIIFLINLFFREHFFEAAHTFGFMTFESKNYLPNKF